jgi:thiol:disulfide interchange protein DsbC
MKLKTLGIVLVLPLLTAAWSLSVGWLPFGVAEAAETEAASSVLEDAGGAKLLSRLKALRPDIPVEQVTESPLPGFYALELTGGTVFYGTADGRYLFAGDLYELGTTDLVNVTDISRAGMRQELMATVALQDMVIFPATADRKGVINVFTDVDCGYCRKLHQEVPELNEMGIEVRYLAYPRAGIGSPGYTKIVSAWCADDRNSALTELKAGGEIPEQQCENPVASQYELGRDVGVTGTPAIVLEDGRLLPGYAPAADLAASIGI